MKKSQRKILYIYAAMLAVIALFIPYFEVTLGQYYYAGYYFVFMPPEPGGASNIFTRYEVNWARIAVEVAAATAVSALLFLMVSIKKQNRR